MLVLIRSFLPPDTHCYLPYKLGTIHTLGNNYHSLGRVICKCVMYNTPSNFLYILSCFNYPNYRLDASISIECIVSVFIFEIVVWDEPRLQIFLQSQMYYSPTKTYVYQLRKFVDMNVASKKKTPLKVVSGPTFRKRSSRATPINRMAASVERIEDVGTSLGDEIPLRLLLWNNRNGRPSRITDERRVVPR